MTISITLDDELATQLQVQAAPVAHAIVSNLSEAGVEWPRANVGVVQAIPATLAKGYDREAAVDTNSVTSTCMLKLP